MAGAQQAAIAGLGGELAGAVASTQVGESPVDGVGIQAEIGGLPLQPFQAGAALIDPLPRRRSTTSLTVAEFEDYVRNIRQLGAELGCDIPEPNEVAAALEATRRLRATLGDGVALMAGLSGPAQLAQDFGRDVAHAGVVFAGLVKEFCVAGADIVLCLEAPTLQPAAAWLEALNTAGNIARFHRALPCLWGVAGPFPAPVAIELNAPVAVATGLITTAAEVPANASIETLRAWVSILASH